MGKFSRLGNELYNGHKSIDFVGKWRRWYAISAVILIVAIGGLVWRGLNLGIEFVGGSEYSVSLPSSQVTQETADALGAAVADLGIKDAEQPVVTTAGDKAILVQTESLSTAESVKVMDALAATAHVDADKDISVSDIGSSWGKDVLNRAILGLIVFLIIVVLFIWGYFREWKMSVAAIVALAHDVLITVGIYALSGFEVSPATVTGILTILGFSLYDTVVVFDKIRENTHDTKSGRTYAESANLAVNQTLVRSINTSIVALLPVAAILYAGVVQLGSGSLKDLALALFVGMAAGAYSSIFIATPLLVQLKGRDADVDAINRRAAARRIAVDPYASVPSYAEGMPVFADPTTTALEQARQGIDPEQQRAEAQRPATRDRLQKGAIKEQAELETPDELK